MKPHVIELLIATKYRVSDLDERDVNRIQRRLNATIFPVKHTSHSFSWLVVTRETAQQLMDRIGPTLETITAISDWRATSLGRDCAARYNIDPLPERLRLAWNEADRRGEWTKPHDLRGTKPGDVYAKHGIEKLDRKTAIKMRLGLLGERKPQSDTDKT